MSRSSKKLGSSKQKSIKSTVEFGSTESELRHHKQLRMNPVGGGAAINRNQERTSEGDGREEGGKPRSSMASLLLIVSCLSLPQIRRPGRVASSKLDGEYPSPDAFLATTAMCGYLRASLPLQALLLLRPLLPRAPRLLSNSSLSLAVGSKLVVGAVGRRGRLG
jgi:hypothetical protein